MTECCYKDVPTCADSMCPLELVLGDAMGRLMKKKIDDGDFGIDEFVRPAIEYALSTAYERLLLARVHYIADQSLKGQSVS